MDTADWLIGLSLVCLALGMLGLLWMLSQHGPPPPPRRPRHRRRKGKD